MTIGSASALQVTAATNASPIVVTLSSNHGLADGAQASIGGMLGNTAGNGDWTITATGYAANQVALNGSTGNGAYTGGGGFWVKGGKQSSLYMTQLDAWLYTRATDKTGDTCSGVWTFAQNATASGNVSGVRANAAGSFVKTTSGARFKHGDGDDVVLDARQRTIMVSCVEAFGEYNGTPGPNGTFSQVTAVASATGAGRLLGIASNGSTTPYTFWMPLTRVHDGATLLKATLYFWPQLVNGAIAQLPTTFPSFTVWRMNPTTDTVPTPLAATGAAVFGGASTPAAYATTSAVGSSGNLVLATLNGGSASVPTGATLVDASGNVFGVTTGGTYANGALIPVSAQAPSSGTFLGGNTNHAAGDSLTWQTSITNVITTASVALGGLTGGLNAGYAQSIVYVPDAANAPINQATYDYFVSWSDDNLAGNGWNATIYTAVRLDFGNITSMKWQ